MERLVKVVSIDEEFDKSRTKGAKDKRPRKKYGIGKKLDYRPARPRGIGERAWRANQERNEGSSRAKGWITAKMKKGI